ncbi:methyltransferase domain-containing protein [Streptomyces beigongshangae]|uniref:methyltransferase domain-containing protein n=1 Tax=Streptomyces beigongshangae TaxID=2841597 RepID=UPI001C8511F3|nr:methyltransferase domain-containing protein [Streptomyces sp. REN17]
MTRIDGHLLDDRRSRAGQQGDALAALFDPTTFRHIERLGIGPGWRCWEVDADGMSVVSWLAKKAGPTGRVVATGPDTSWAPPAVRPPIQLRVHDVGVDGPPAEGLDFVHARLVLAGVPDRRRALRTMIGALRPGGRLLVEDTDLTLQPLACPDEHGPEQQLANRVRHAVRDVLAERGVEVAYGRRLPRLLREAGLRQVGADAYFPLTSPACGALDRATVGQVRAQLVAAGLATDQDIDRHLANVAAGGLDLVTEPLISAWGRKP